MSEISLEEYFEGFTVIPTVTAVEYVRLSHPHISDSTARGYVSEMVNDGLLKRVGKGKYVLGESREYNPGHGEDVRALHLKLKEEYPFLDVCIWHTSQLNEFLQHQLVRHFMLIEVEQEAVETVFEFIKDEGFVTLSNPSAEVLEKYTANEGDTYIIMPLVSEAPIVKKNKFQTASIEKILVDVFCDRGVFNSIQGSELTVLFMHAFEKYTINRDRLLRYAGRRGKKSEIEKFINELDTDKK